MLLHAFRNIHFSHFSKFKSKISFLFFLIFFKLSFPRCQCFLLFLIIYDRSLRVSGGTGAWRLCFWLFEVAIIHQYSTCTDLSDELSNLFSALLINPMWQKTLSHNLQTISLTNWSITLTSVSNTEAEKWNMANVTGGLKVWRQSTMHLCHYLLFVLLGFPASFSTSLKVSYLIYFYFFLICIPATLPCWVCLPLLPLYMNIKTLLWQAE